MAANKCQFRSKSVFGGDTYVCPEETLPGSQYCIFHDPREDKDGDTFLRLLNQKIEKRDFNFTGFVFPSNLPKRIGREGYHRFGRLSTIKTDKTHSQFISFEFSGIEFDDVQFSEAWFPCEVDFRGCIFKGSSLFDKVTFRGGADFYEAVVGEYLGDFIDFTEAVFESVSVFLRANVNAMADFRYARFKDEAYFENTKFEKEVYFNSAIFDRIATFEEAVFNGPVSFASTKFCNDRDAEVAYLKAKIYYQSRGQYRDAGRYYLMEVRAARRQKSLLARAAEYLFLDLTCGYGEQPLKTILTAMATILVFALAYWTFGGFGSSEAILHSGFTFTTLGMWVTTENLALWVKCTMILEAFLGVLVLALFIVTFARADLLKEALHKHNAGLMSLIEQLASVLQPLPASQAIPWREFDKGSLPFPGGKVQYETGLDARVWDVTLDIEAEAQWQLLLEHLKHDPLTRALNAWRKTLSSHIEARVNLKQELVELLESKTGYQLENEPAGDGCLIASAVDHLFHYLLMGLPHPVDINRMAKNISADSDTGQVKYGGGTTLAFAPGEEEDCKNNIIDALKKLSMTKSMDILITTCETHRTSSDKASRGVEEIRMMGLIPGQCRICRRLGM